MKIKVIFILDTLANAGTENSLLLILPYFSETIDYKVVYLYPNHHLLEKYNQANIPTHFLNLKGNYDFINGFKKLKKLFQDEKPDLVVSSLLRSNLLTRMVCKFMKIPLIGTLVSDSYHKDSIKIKSFFVKIKFKFFWGLDSFSSHIPKLYIANSSSIVSTHNISLGIPTSKTKVIYRGRIIPERVWNAEINDKGNFKFLSYGRLIPLKGYKELIEAFNEVQKEYPNCSLTIFGEGNYRGKLEQLINQFDLKNKVSLPGIHHKVTEELYNYNCYVFTSWYEGFSGTLIEAMLAGIPIIASDIPMNLEAIKADETALTFPVKNVEFLAKQMIFAIKNPEIVSRLGIKAREEAINRFDIKKTAKQYEDTLCELFAEIHR